HHRCGQGRHLEHRGLGLADRESARRVAVERNRGYLRRTNFAEVLENAALYYSEQRLRCAFPRREAAPGPSRGQLKRLERAAMLGRERRAFVERHHDI